MKVLTVYAHHNPRSFCAATSATPDRVQQYFQQAYQLGRDFERPAAGARHSTTAA